ncbi:MAG: hypothetical protein ABSE63_06290 [Thermoguttaceae bacterium]|jgi:hypothetical protein
MKKWKKYLLWTGIGTGAVITILLIFSVLYHLIFGTPLDRKIAALRKSGEPICLADLARKSIPPDQNGLSYLLRVKKDLDTIDKELFPLSDNEGNYKPENMKIIEEIFQAYPNVYPLLEQAAACTDFDLHLDFNLTPNKFNEKLMEDIGSLFRPTERYLDARIRLLLSQGESDEALRSTILRLQFSRHLENEPLILSYATALGMKKRALECANEILQAGSVNDNIRDMLDKELSLHGSMEKFRNALISERAFALDQYRYVVPHSWMLILNGQQNLIDQGELSVLSAYENDINYSFHPLSDLVTNKTNRVVSTMSWNNIGYLAIPVLHQTLISAYRAQALVRALCIINALQRTNPADNDKTPTMAELGLPNEVGIDPFNGKTMIIKKLANGWLVYSVGENLQDDGGKVEEESNNKPLDVGFGPKTAPKQAQEK